MENKKYKLTDETIDYCRVVLHRIEALKDFGDIKKGDKGGWVEKETNLSQYGTCWIFSDAKVYGDAKVFDYAEVFGNAEVFGDAAVYDNAKVYDNAEVYGNTRIHDNVEVYGNVYICGNTRILEYARIYDTAKICGDINICGNAKIHGDIYLATDCFIQNEADIEYIRDIFVVGPIGSRDDKTTFYRGKGNNTIMVKCGCFNNTIDEFLKRVEKIHGNDFHGQDYKLACKLAKSRILENRTEYDY